MTLFSEAKGRKVVDLTTATTIGIVDDYLVDARAKTVAAVVLKKSTGSGNLLAWSHIAAFGADALTVADQSAVTVADSGLEELAEKSKAFNGKQVLTTAGELIGTVTDIDFDADSGALSSVLLGKDDSIAGDRVMATGSYAVIVQA